MNIREAHIKFGTDEQCLAYIEQMRWPDGVVRCPVCGTDKIQKAERKAESKNKRAWFYLCLEKSCHHQFTPTAGTIFHDTHLPLIVWFQALTLVLNAKKGISAKQLQRDLGIGGYKTAWYLLHRIRESMQESDMTPLGGIVEVDETYIGGKTIRRKDRGNRKPKDTVLGMVERGGRIRFQHIGNEHATAKKVGPVVTAFVAPDACIMTDESTIYPYGLSKEHLAQHKTINHSKEYVRYENDLCITTNHIESAFSLLKRGIIGNFHKVSIKHLHRYLREFEFRFNRRREPEQAFIDVVRQLTETSPLRFAALTSEKA